MFEQIDRQSWLRYPLPDVVRYGLEQRSRSKEFFPNGISETLEPTEIVATGQQPGFLGGPLYSLYKRWTAQLTSTTNAPYFWIEGGDSDWEEVSKVHWQSQIITSDDELPNVPMTDRMMPTNLFDKLSSTLPSQTQQEIFETFREAFQGSVVDSFIKCNELAGKPIEQTKWFEGPPNLNVTLDESYRTLLSDWFLEFPNALKCLRIGIERNRSQFQSVQAELLANRTGWFFQAQPQEKRFPVLTDGISFQIGETKFQREALARFVKDTKGNFIPGALWRTLVQQAICQPSNVVVGVSEAAYWSEVVDLFDWAGLPFPRLTLRIGMTLLPRRFSQLRPNEILASIPPVIDKPERWQNLHSKFDEIHQEFIDLIQGFPDHLRHSIQKSMEKMSYQFQKVVEISDRFYDDKSGSKKKLWQLATQEIGLTSIPQERKMTLLEAYLHWGDSLNELYEMIQTDVVSGRYIFIDKG